MFHMDAVLVKIKALPIDFNDSEGKPLSLTYEKLATMCRNELKALVVERVKPEDGEEKSKAKRVATGEVAKVKKYLEVITSMTKKLHRGVKDGIKTLKQGNRYATPLLNKLKPSIGVSTLVSNTKSVAAGMTRKGVSAGEVSEGDIKFMETHMQTMEQLIANNNEGIKEFFQVLTNRKFDIKLSSFCDFSDELKNKLDGLKSLIFTVKELAVESLSQFMINLANSSGAGAVMSSVIDLGLDGMVTALGGIASDAVKSMLAKQQFPRLREVSAFCAMRLLASMENGKVKDMIRGKVAERQAFESEIRVRNIMSGADDNVYASDANVVLWPTVSFQTSEEKRAADKEAERKAFVRQEENIYAEFISRLASLEAGREAAEAESDPLKKQEILACCCIEQQALKQAALRVTDMSKKLNVIVNYLADIQSQLALLDKKLDRLQADVTDIRNDIKRLIRSFILTSLLSFFFLILSFFRFFLFPSLIRKPPLEVIADWRSKFLKDQSWALPNKVYIEAEVCGPGEKKNFKVDDNNKASPVTEAFRSFMGKDPTSGETGIGSSVAPPADEETTKTETDEVAAPVSAGGPYLTKDIGPKNIMLLSGLAGSGKSTVVEKIKQYLLDEYTKQRAREGKTVVLIFVSLPALNDPLGGVFEEVRGQRIEDRDFVLGPAYLTYFLSSSLQYREQSLPLVYRPNSFKSCMKTFRRKTAPLRSSSSSTPTMSYGQILHSRIYGGRTTLSSIATRRISLPTSPRY